MAEAVWLVCVIAAILAWTSYDVRQYAAFKPVEDSQRRQVIFLRWAAQGFVVMTGLSILTLIILGRSEAPFELPFEFQDVASALQDGRDQQSSKVSVSFIIGLVFGWTLLGIAQFIRARRMLKPDIATIEPLLPRNRREILAVIPLCLNAGFSEELLFRLALPLLIYHVSGSVVVAFVTANFIFGIAHAYQGWKGVVMTALAGLVLTWIYLSTGSLLRVMILHAAIDVMGLIIRPIIVEKLRKRLAKSSAEGF